MKRAGILIRIHIAAAVVVGFSGLGARAQDIPKIDYASTCRDTPPVAMDKKATYEQCMADEKAARDSLQQTWSKAPAKSRGQCTEMTRLGGQSSYVELITCLEMENPAASKGDAGPAGTNVRNPHPQPTAK